jgi:CRP-like cAMP-binding protein
MDPIQQLSDLIDEHELWEYEHLLQRGDYLVESGQVDSRIYLVLDGSLHTFIWQNNSELSIRFGYSGNLIAALDSFITETPTQLNIQALKQTTLSSLSKTTFMDFIHSNTERLDLWMQLQQLFILQMMQREQDLLTSSPAERYQRVRQRSPELFQEIPNKYIASYLRMTPETLSRIKKS